MVVNNKFEEAKKTRIIVSITILLIIIAILSVLVIQRYNQINTLNNDIKSTLNKKEKNEKHNANVEKQTDKLNKEVGTQDVIDTSTRFDDKFFDWSTWQEYSKNMKSLAKDYPNIESEEIVDLSGKKVGTGESPDSEYTKTSYTTTKEGEVAEFIEQHKSMTTKETRTLWYKVSNYKNGKYDITSLKNYSEVL